MCLFFWMDETCPFQIQKHKRGDSETFAIFTVSIVLPSFMHTPGYMCIHHSHSLPQFFKHKCWHTMHSILHLGFFFWLHSIFQKLLQVSMCRAALFFQWLYNYVGVSLDMKHVQLSVMVSYKAEQQHGMNMGFGIRQNLGLNPGSVTYLMCGRG